MPNGRNDKVEGGKDTLDQRIFTLAIVCMAALALAFQPYERYDGKQVDTIMLDAGHGGKDPGNLGTGRYSSTEKDVVLEVTNLVGSYIEEYLPDVEVSYTRTGDSYPELHERTKMANRLGVDLFVSIHCDAFSKESAHGCGSYVMGQAKTDANLRMAQKENAAMLKEKDYEKNYGGFDPYSPESYIELSLRQNAFMDQSLMFSKNVQDQFRERVQRTDRGVRQAPYWVISFTTMPSVLIELGFLTNEEEEDFLQSKRGRELMASAIFRAFRDYKSSIEGKDYSQGPSDIIVEEARPEEERNDSEMYFTIQVGSASSAISTEAANFKGLEGVKQVKVAGLYKYVYGTAGRYNDTKRLLKEVKAAGIEGAFVIALKGEERIDLNEAIQTLGK